MNARDSAERLAALETSLEAAEAARQAIETGEAELALLRLPEKAVAELEALEVELAKLEAVAEASRPSVAIAYAPGAPAVSLDGLPLIEGQPRSHDGKARLQIPGVGVVTLNSGRLPEGDQKLRQARERRGALLAALGVADLAEARRRFRRGAAQGERPARAQVRGFPCSRRTDCQSCVKRWRGDAKRPGKSWNSRATRHNCVRRTRRQRRGALPPGRACARPSRCRS